MAFILFQVICLLQAQILLSADEVHPGGAIKGAETVRALGTKVCTVERTRGALVEHGLQITVQSRPSQRKASRPKTDGWTEAHLIVATCGAPPQDRSRWTRKLLSDHVVVLGLVETISPQTIGRTLKKTR